MYGEFLPGLPNQERFRKNLTVPVNEVFLGKQSSGMLFLEDLKGFIGGFDKVPVQNPGELRLRVDDFHRKIAHFKLGLGHFKILNLVEIASLSPFIKTKQGRMVGHMLYCEQPLGSFKALDGHGIRTEDFDITLELLSQMMGYLHHSPSLMESILCEGTRKKDKHDYFFYGCNLFMLRLKEDGVESMLFRKGFGLEHWEEFSGDKI